MTVLFRYSPRLLLGAALILGSGCAAKNPEWLTAPTGAFCASGLSDGCLKSLAEKAYADATAKQAAIQKSASAPVTDKEAGAQPSEKENQPSKTDADQPEAGILKQDADQPVATPTVEHTATSDKAEGQGSDQPQPSVLSSGGADKPTGKSTTAIEVFPHAQSAVAPVEHEVPETINDPIPSLAFGIAAIGATATETGGYLPTEKVVEWKEAGGLLNVGAGPVTNAQIKQASKIADKELRANTLIGMLSLHSRSMTEEQINGVLNELYALDKGQYANALIVKLPGLLKVGDLERAKELRLLLLKSAATQDRPFSMLAFVATCYTMAGMKQDAGDIVRESIQGGDQLTADDQKLIRLSITVANGAYPMMQDFYDFESDDARLSAYLTIAVIARQLGEPSVTHRAIADAVKFIQKAAVKVDRQKALSQILAVSPGVI